MSPHSFLDFSRFRPPTASEQQEYILCTQCHNAQGVEEIGSAFLCQDCYDKWLEQNENKTEPEV